MEEKDPEVFLSLAFDEESAKIAGQLEHAFLQKGITLISDKSSLKHGAAIADFMAVRDHVKPVIILISDKYLRSDHCIFELLEVLKSPNYPGTVFSILLTDSDIFDPQYNRQLFEYWQNRKTEFYSSVFNADINEIIRYKQVIDSYNTIIESLKKTVLFRLDKTSENGIEAVVAKIGDLFTKKDDGELLRTINKKNRYPGVRPFTGEESHVFYGRDDDKRKLYQLINLEKLVLLYGKSGLGKSSLLNAGVLPLFEEDSGIEIARIRFGAYTQDSKAERDENAPVESPVQISLSNLPAAPSNKILDKIGAGANTLWLRIKAMQSPEPLESHTYILVYDQFEELFTYPQEEIVLFKKQLADLLSAQVPSYISRSITNRIRNKPGIFTQEELAFIYREPLVKVVLSIRSDRMSLLNTLTDYLPDILKNYYELKPLDRNEAIEAIVKPARDTRDIYLSRPFDYTPNCIDTILSYLTGDSQKSIETFQLQTVCQFAENLQVEAKLPFDQKRKVSIVEPGVLGDLENIFRKQYDKLIANIQPPEKGLAVRHLLEDKLIIDGTRVSLPEKVVLLEKGIDKEIINYLHEIHHVLRSEPNTTGGISYELSHDTLVAPVLKAKKEREEEEGVKRREKERIAELADLEQKRQEAIQQAEKEKREREKEKKYQRRIIVTISVAAVIAVGLAVFGIFMWLRADKESRKAQSLTLVAFSREQLEKDPTLALRLSELAWKQYPSRPVPQTLEQLAGEAYYGIRANNIFYSCSLMHDSAVIGAVFSPDGKTIVTASVDNTAKLWDVETGKELANLKGHKGLVYSAVFSLDGKTIVTASADNTAKLWNAQTGKELASLKGHKGLVYSAVFSPDGKTIVTASGDNTAKVWDVQTGKELASLKGHKGLVRSAGFSPDGKTIVTASGDNTAKLWNAQTGKELASLKGHKGFVRSAGFSPDGKTIVTASWDNTAKVWDMQTGKELASLKGHNDYVYSAVFSPDGKTIVTASGDNTAKLWNAQTGKELASFKGHTGYVFRAVFSPDGKTIVTASVDNTAKVWDVETGKELASLKGHKGYVYRAVFSSDGKTIVTASEDNTAKVWAVQTGKELASLKGHENLVGSAGFSADSKTIVTTSDDNTAKVWDVETGKELASLKGHTGLIYRAVFSPHSKMIVTASWDNTPKVWDAQTGKELASLKGHNDYVYSAVFSPDSKMIMTTSYDSIAKVWDAQTGKELANLKGHDDYNNKAVFSPDSKMIVTTSNDSTAKVWDAQTGKELVSLKGHEDKVISAVFSPDGKKIVTASWDNTAKVWDVQTGKELASLKGHKNLVNSAVFSPDGKTIVTASSDNTVKVWDAQTGKELASFKGHENPINCSVFSPDGKTIVTAADDSTAKVWNAQTGKELASLKGHEDKVISAVFSPDGKKILTASEDGTAKVWLTPEALIDWLGKQDKIYRLKPEDLKKIGVDFVDSKMLKP